MLRSTLLPNRDGRLTQVLASRWSPSGEHNSFEIFQLLQTITFIIPLPRGTRLRRSHYLRWHLTICQERILSVHGTKCLEIKHWAAGTIQTELSQEKRATSILTCNSPETPPCSLGFSFHFGLLEGLSRSQVGLIGQESRPRMQASHLYILAIGKKKES